MKYLISLVTISLLFIFFTSCSDDTQNGENKIIACTTIDDCGGDYKCIDGFCKKEVIKEECLDNNDCPIGYECTNEQKCVEKLCAEKDDCGTGFICQLEKCIVGCESNNDCNTNEKCNFESKKCEEDNPEEDCRINPDVCEQGFDCDEITGVCKVSTTCNTDEDCAADSTCEEHNCIPRMICSSNDECSGEEICREDGYCGPDNGCTTDDYCMNQDPTKPACNVNSGVCYECITNDHCEAEKECDVNRNICVDAGSAICTTDEDCGLNRNCEDGTCVSIFGNTCTSDADCIAVDQGKCLTDADPSRCVQCLQDDQCDTAQICNINTHLCEEQGSGADCTTDEDCDILAGETCVNEQCYNPNSSGNDGVTGLCDEDLGGSMCVLLFGGSCNGDLLTNPNCSLDPLDLDIWCGDCVFE